MQYLLASFGKIISIAHNLHVDSLVLLLLCFAFPLRKNPLEILGSLPLVRCRTSPQEYLTNLRDASLLPLRNLLELLPQL